jgi:hypothetical protein
MSTTSFCTTPPFFSMQMYSGNVVDPSYGGGVAVKANQKHGSECNVALYTPPQVPENYAMLSPVVQDILRGAELFWDYSCVTDNPLDHLRRIKCKCGGLEIKTTFMGQVETLRACTGCLLESTDEQGS